MKIRKMPRMKSDVADAVDDERLLPGITGAAAIEVIADQQIRAESHSLPSDKHQQEVAGQNQDQHRKQE